MSDNDGLGSEGEHVVSDERLVLCPFCLKEIGVLAFGEVQEGLREHYSRYCVFPFTEENPFA